MAVPFLYLVLSFIFFLPNICCSCRRSLCGNITIEYPFSLNHTTSPNSPPPSNGLPMVPLQHPNSPPPSNGLPMVPLQHVDDCDGFLTINCNQGQATITIRGHEFVVMDIAYSNRVITIQDIALSHYHFHIPCAFFVNFTHPIYGYDLFNYSQVEGFRKSSQDRELGFGISQTLWAEPFSLTECEDYSLYYWNELNQHDVNESCKTDQPAFEWKLSYNELKGRFSLLSVGFSQHFQLREDCFNCHVDGKSCTSNKGAVNSSCWCETTCESKDQLPFKKSTTNKREIIGIVGGVAGGFILLGILVIFCYKRKKRYLQSGLSGLLSWSSSSKKSSKKDVEVGESNYHTHIFSYDELEEATSGFNASEELGDGGFGTVYKGKLRDGRTVAVKRLYEHNYRRLEQFMNEVEILSRLRHQNLVTLYGCTSRHSRELLLVYEYIPNGTVADHLHGSLASKASLTWPIRLSIAIETADALAYLHHAEPQIIHRDVKTNNILLDNHHHVKVADFGLSRLFPLDATHVSTAPQGTPGYVDPEYHQCYQLTDKSDVYSFGVVLIELISSKPAVDISRHRHEINLANLAVNKIQNCQLDQLVDTNLGYDVDLEVKRMIDQVAELAFRCLQSDGEMRPGIREVLEMLRVIGNGGYNEEGEGDGSEVMTKEESTFVKSGVPVSPDTVTGRWASRTSTPNTST